MTAAKYFQPRSGHFHPGNLNVSGARLLGAGVILVVKHSIRNMFLFMPPQILVIFIVKSGIGCLLNRFNQLTNVMNHDNTRTVQHQTLFFVCLSMFVLLSALIS